MPNSINSKPSMSDTSLLDTLALAFALLETLPVASGGLIGADPRGGAL